MAVALVYLVDVVEFLRTLDENVDHVRLVLTLLYDPGVTLNLEKCKCFTNRIYKLSYVNRPGRLAESTRTTDAICRIQYPTSVMELRSSLGLCKVFHQLGSNVIRITAPLTQKLRGGQPQTFHELTDDETTALEALIAKLMDPSTCTSTFSRRLHCGLQRPETSRLNVFSCRSIPAIPTNQSEMCLVCLKT